MNVLVVYYSRSGNTKAVGRLIADSVSGDLEEIVEIGVNRKGLIGWLRAGRGGMLKQSSQIKAPEKSPDDYDLVFVGAPVWGGNLPPAIRSYLSQMQFGSTPVALFCTMAGRDQEKRTFASMRELAPGAKIVGEMAVQAAALKNPQVLRAKISEWVNGFKSLGSTIS